ncbi:MAG: transcriptional antiterminator, Rof [bacterium]
MDKYRPISCERHSDYELAVMHGTERVFHWKSEDGHEHQARLKPIDVRVHDGGEYLVLVDEKDTRKELRLDWIISMSDG